MKRLVALLAGGLLLGACRDEEASRISASGDTTRSADGQTVVTEYSGSKGFVLTDEYLESTEGGAVASTLRRLGVRFVSVLTGDEVPFQPVGVGGIPVHGWNRIRWARDVGPVSAISHSSEDLRLLQLGRVTEAGRAIAKWLGREIVEGPNLPDGASLMINAYADCFVAKLDGLSPPSEADLSAAFREKAGCRRVTFLDTIPTISVTKQLDQWVRFLSNDAVAVARLVDFTGDEGLSGSPSLLGVRKFWDDEARAMNDRGYNVIRLPVFVHKEGNRRLFSSLIPGVIVQRNYLAPDFPSLKESFGVRYEAEQDALERDMRSLGFEVKWVLGEDSARLGGSIQRAVLSVHDHS